MPRKKKSNAGRPRKNPLDIRVPANFSIPRNVFMQFKDKCTEYGVSHNDVLTELIKDFNNK